jgi:hypothetical protein
MSSDLILALRAPAPVVRYVEDRLRVLELHVTRLEDVLASDVVMLLVTAKGSTLEAEAEFLKVEKLLAPSAARTFSESHHPYRIFRRSDRASFAGAGEGGVRGIFHVCAEATCQAPSTNRSAELPTRMRAPCLRALLSRWRHA